MAYRGRLEAQYYFATSQEATFNNGGGAQAVSVPAGSYYLAELVTAVNADLTNMSVAISDGESSDTTVATGKATITSSGTVTVTWTDTTLRDALGFTGDLSGAASPQTGTRACPGVWLPCNPAKFSRHGDYDAGSIVSTFRQTVGPTGVVYSVGGGTSSYSVINGLLWDGVPATRAKIQYNASGTQTSVTNETLDEFLRNTQLGTGTYASLFTIGSSCRIYWNADDDTKYVTGKFTFPPTFDPDTMIQGWTGRYRCPMARFVIGA